MNKEQINSWLKGKFKAFLLKGAAGTGKTTRIKEILEQRDQLPFEDFILMAPTGRAARVIGERTGRFASTIHKGIYDMEKIEKVPPEGPDEVEGASSQEKKEDEEELEPFKRFHFKLKEERKRNTLFIVDEASMIADQPVTDDLIRFGSGRLLKDLIEYTGVKDEKLGNGLLFIGDPYQLPPVEDSFSPALNASYLKDTFGLSVEGTELTEIFRSDAEQLPARNAYRVKDRLVAGSLNRFKLEFDEEGSLRLQAKAIEASFNQQSSKAPILITYSNPQAYDLNRRIRADHFGAERAEAPLIKGELLVIDKNNTREGLLNGEFARVDHFDPEPRRVRIKPKGKEPVDLRWWYVHLRMRDLKGEIVIHEGWVLENTLVQESRDLTREQLQALMIDRRKRFEKGDPTATQEFLADVFAYPILVKYGNAVTAHKAQGGEWKDVFVLWPRGNAEQATADEPQSGKDNEDFFRWAYTAMTRAQDRVFHIDPPSFHPFSPLQFVDPEVDQALEERQEAERIEWGANAEELLRVFSMEKEAEFLQKHLVQREAQFRKYDYQLKGRRGEQYHEILTFEKGGEAVRIAFNYNKKGKFSSTRILDNPGSNGSITQAELEGILSEPLPIIRFPEKGNEEPNEKEPCAGAVPYALSLLQSCLKEKATDHGFEIRSHESHDFLERYELQREGESHPVDLHYNNRGFFKKARIPQGKTVSPSYAKELRELVEDLKKAPESVSEPL